MAILRRFCVCMCVLGALVFARTIKWALVAIAVLCISLTELVEWIACLMRSPVSRLAFVAICQFDFRFFIWPFVLCAI